MLTKALKQSEQATNQDHAAPDTSELTLDQYKKARSKYVRDGGGTPPPGATPVDNLESN